MSENRKTGMSRRAVTAGALSMLAVGAACSNGVGNENAKKLDARVQATLNEMYANYPNTRDIAASAAGMLVMPLVTEAGFWLGGGYGQGALLVDGRTVDYYSAIQGSAGLQAGVQQYSYVLFFMTEEVLNTFRTGQGWDAALDAGGTLLDEGTVLRATTASATSPVLIAVFGQAGAFVGATVEGIKYTRIIP